MIDKISKRSVLNRCNYLSRPYHIKLNRKQWLEKAKFLIDEYKNSDLSGLVSLEVLSDLLYPDVLKGENGDDLISFKDEDN